MSLQLYVIPRLGALQELLLQCLWVYSEGDIHPTPRLPLDNTLIDGAPIDGLIQSTGLPSIRLLHPRHAALGDVNPKHGRGVVQRVVVCVRLVIQHERAQRGAFRASGRVRAYEQVTPDNDDGDAGGANVLLSACVDDAEPRDIDAAGEDIGGHVNDEGDGRVYVWNGGELDAVDGFVVTVVDVSGVWAREAPLRGRGDACVGAAELLGVDDNVDVGAEPGGLFGSLGGPRARDEVIDEGVGRGGWVEFAVSGEKVVDDGGELSGAAALHEEDVVIVGDGEEMREVLLGLVYEGFKILGPVRELQD
ncbi:hypothetical protein BC938DRAFT_472984 [Jimgerdemannia flammicorona]|uniref:Uncharacterized protein n=1 Tax=Jimgerdemannia flammicorona TaxID=994334 RepID=A0A433Q505_9FUNG|nr:hypothetical protein BC938DRAFT_472984 [Jimgerdemannia flammicorona]